MKLVSYNKEDQDQLAIFSDGLLYDTDLMHPDLPVSMGMFLNYWEDVFTITAAINKKLEEGKISRQQGFKYDAAEIFPPVPHAISFRKASAFKQPIIVMQNTGSSTVVSEFDKHPFFSFANHNSFQGPGNVLCMPGLLQKLDFSPEVAIVICKAGKNIKAAEADEYIGGYMIANNFSSTHFNISKMSDLSFANAKSFATPIGPLLVTTDELEPYKVETKPGHIGNVYNLSMKCFINDVLVSEGNLADLDWTFAEIIEEASYGVQLFPGDIISSGPVNSERFVQLNTAGKLNDPNYEEQWLKEGDVIELKVEALGNLINTIMKDESDLSVEGDENIDES